LEERIELTGLRSFEGITASNLIYVLDLESFEEKLNFKFDLVISHQSILGVLTELIDLTDYLQNTFHPRVRKFLEDLRVLSFFENSADECNDQLAVFVVFESHQE
jgi:hypothetical protein